MTSLSIHLPFKYFSVTQHWNNPNPAYQPFGFKNHNGTDCVSGYANEHAVYAPKSWNVYCPVEGFKVQLVRNNPQGGGNELWMLSKEKMQIGDKFCYAYFVMCHAEKIFVQVGDEPALGELVMIADSTGFSSGPHVHMGLYRVDYDGIRFTYLDQNDANGSYSPESLFSHLFAVDLASLTTLIKSNWRYYQYVLGLK